MLLKDLHPQSSTPLVVQIVGVLRRLIAAGTLRPGAKIASIRQFAAAHRVSVFTVVEACDRLVALGWLVSRPHSGFFVRERAGHASEPASASPEAGATGPSFDSMWYLRKTFESRHLSMKPAAAGCPATGCSRRVCGAACAHWQPRRWTSAAMATPRASSPCAS